MAEKWEDLPEECWELIVNRINHHSHFESLSLVSKRFLSITNRLRFRLTIIDPTLVVHGTITKLIHRFQNLKTLDFSQFHGNLDPLLFEIAYSSLLNLEALDISYQKTFPIKGLRELGLKMKNLRVLKCETLDHLCDRDLGAIANSLPRLEELDISYPFNSVNSNYEFNSISSEVTVTDSGIEALCFHLRNLGKVNISGNVFITDRSLVALSLNCLFLREIVVLDCSLITENGIHFMLCNSPDLSVVSVKGIRVLPRSLHSLDSITYGRALCSLDFYSSVIPDEFLCSIAKACIPLKRIVLSYCTDFTFSGISLLLYTYQSLEYLALENVCFLTDHSVRDLSLYLRNLVAIKLDICPNLTDSTFFFLTKNCPSLKDIEMKRTNMGKEGYFMELVKNPRIKSLNLAKNSYLSDECLVKVALVCPNLKLLDLWSCSGITEGGIAEVLKLCREIRHLSISKCGGIKSLGTASEFLKLEILDAARSGFNDEGLETIGKRCCRLLKLDLTDCVVATTRRVMEVVRNCKRLREINLKRCLGLNFSIADWIVFSRSSVKKIVPPDYKAVAENQRKFLLRHGCLVCEPKLSKGNRNGSRN